MQRRRKKEKWTSNSPDGIARSLGFFLFERVRMSSLFFLGLSTAPDVEEIKS